MIPQRTRWRALWSSPVPKDEDGNAGLCPRCGRRLPPFALNELSAPRNRWTNDADLIQACLVDGRRSRHAEPFAVEDLFASAVIVADAFTAHGWTAWGALVRSGTGGALDARRMEEIGRAFEVTRRFGPQRARVKDLPLHADPLEVLVTSTARHWPSIKER